MIKSPFDIVDVWTSSYSSNTNEIMWGAKFAARCPWISCVIRLSSYECGMDQPTYTPTQKIVEASGTLFFKFGDLDSTKPSGSIKIRVETIVHYMAKYSEQIMHRKFGWLSPRCPLGDTRDGQFTSACCGCRASKRRSRALAELVAFAAIYTGNITPP